jgi:hypothetical protein
MHSLEIISTSISAEDLGRSLWPKRASFFSQGGQVTVIYNE